MELDDIRRVQADWVRGCKAGRAPSASTSSTCTADTSYLLTQFLSPFTNKRTDAYGGSLENRSRMWIETLELVKEAVGDAAAVAVRIGVDLTPGIDVDEALAFVRLADPLVDLWDVNVGSIALWSHDSGASRFFAEGYQLEWTARVREATAKPIVGVGRFTSPDRMAEVIRSGAIDLIGAARPSIADPFLPRKIEEGRYDEIRECIGCNVCISRSESGHHLGCTQNATAGEEYRRGWHPERFERAANADRDVLVVGAGPAGMECAIVLGKRGFRRVHLVDAAAEIGGSMRWVPQLPGLGEWARVVNWRRIQLEKLKNVEVLTGLRARRGRCAHLRRRARDRGDGLPLGGERAQRNHPRADPRRRLHAALGADARAGDDRGEAPARQPRRRLRRRGLLRRRRHRRAARGRGLSRSSS